MTATIVTAYVPLLDHPRPPAEYRALMKRLTALPVPCMACEVSLDQCWLYKWLFAWSKDVTWSKGDNPQKNSLFYHIVQAQKTEWLWLASAANSEADIFVWIDSGIYHLPSITDRVIIDFMKHVSDSHEQAIAIPGCWEKEHAYDDLVPCWRFCGGVLIVPRRYIVPLDVMVKRQYVHRILSTGNVTWDVNIWSCVEHDEPRLPIWWYSADHDASMFTAYRSATTQ